MVMDLLNLFSGKESRIVHVREGCEYTPILLGL